MVPAGFDVAFLDHPQEILVLSCVLRLVGGTEGALRLSGVTEGVLSRSISVHMARSSQRRFFGKKTQGKLQSNKSIPKRFSCNSTCKKARTQEITSPPKPNMSMKTLTLLSALFQRLELLDVIHVRGCIHAVGLWLKDNFEATLGIVCSLLLPQVRGGSLSVSLAAPEEENNSFLMVFPFHLHLEICVLRRKSQSISIAELSL